MKTTHTPGAWIARRGTIGTVQFHIAEMMPSGADDMPPGFAPAEQQEANAKLIASAPDLLAALQGVRDFWAGGDCPPELWDQISAAIAKAGV